MKRTLMFFLTTFLAAVGFVTIPCLARGASGTVESISGDKVVVQLEAGKGAGFPVGMRDVEIRQSGNVCVRGRVTASGKDKITIKVVRGKVSTLRAGTSVDVGQAADAGAEGIDGC